MPPNEPQSGARRRGIATEFSVRRPTCRGHGGYAKNDHLGFQVGYMWAGSRRRYVPDFLVRLADDTILALEIKGSDSSQNSAKRDALNEWVKAINAAGGFGRWAWDVAFGPGDVQDIITKHAPSPSQRNRAGGSSS